MMGGKYYTQHLGGPRCSAAAAIAEGSGGRHLATKVDVAGAVDEIDQKAMRCTICRRGMSAHGIAAAILAWEVQ